MRSNLKGIARTLAVLSVLATVLLSQDTRLRGPIDSRQTVALRGNVNPIAQEQLAEGRVDPFLKMGRITLLLKPSAAQQAALEQLLTEQQDPSSPHYHAWLTPEEYADRFGASSNDVAEIASWLQSDGFVVEEVARGRNWIAFSGTAGLVERAFATEIQQYRRDEKLHFANATEPSIPAALEPLVMGLVGLDDVHPKPAHVRRTAGPALPWLNPANPDFNFGSGHFLAPDDVAVIYDLNPLYAAGFDGTGRKIVVAGQSSVDLTDINKFRSLFHLSVNPPQIVLVGPDPGQVSDEMAEADLDLEWVGAVARGATIIYVYAQDIVTATQSAINQNLAPIISWSYGSCEVQNSSSGRQFFRSLAQQAVAQGITWLASSGDSGPADCDAHGLTSHPKATQGLSVSLPAGVPEVTGVGGTRFNEGSGTYWGTANGPNSGSALSYIPETSWNDSIVDGDLSATGGGASIAFAKPVWQSAPGVPADGARDVPDVSLSASADHDGYIVCNAGSCAGNWPPQQLLVFGGTSASAPAFAGMLALLQQYLIANHFQSTPGLGNINPTLYRLAQNSPTVFHDVVSGNNIVPCSGTGCPAGGSFGYSAGPGYDQVTGLGSVDGNNLVTNWSTDLCSYSLTPSSATVSSGSSSGSVAITTQSWCAWNALSDSPWLTITSSTSGQGSGSLNYSVTSNGTSSARTGGLHIAGATFTLTQNSTTPSPLLSITKTHSGSFSTGQQNAVYTVTVSNGANAGPTSGTVTVTETVPSGLTLVSMAGTGWTCPGTASNNCTRSSVLAASASYPSIAVTVNVAANAASPQVNSVSVSGGGSAAANTTDSTNIITNQPPAAVSVTPSSGSGSSQTFSFVYSDGNGFTDLATTYMLVNATLNWPGACSTYYDRSANALWLLNDAANLWMGPVTPGAATTLQNSQCSLSGAGSSVSGSGNNLTINLALTFKAAFGGTKNIYMNAQDSGGLWSNWQLRGTWTVPIAGNAPPIAVSATPSSGSGSSQTFSLVFSDPNGYTDLATTYMLVNATLNWPGACSTYYDRSANALWLLSDSAMFWMGPLAPGAATTLQNSQCSLSGGGSSVSGSGSNLTINLALTFKAAFGGVKNVYMNAQDSGGLWSNWQQRGAWTVPGAGNAPPATVSVTPSSGSGSSQTFSFVFSDPNGYTDLSTAYMLVNSTLNWPGACSAYYDRSANALWLLNDAANLWIGPVTPGAATTMQNSQCSLSGAGSSVSGSGNNLTVNLALTFKGAFGGTKNVYMNAQDSGGLWSNWQQRGTWTVQ
jgi:uncharacterized repeat protein (TIGR01451 family)